MESVRSQFPALRRVHGGHPVAYFDGPGGTQVPQVVVDAMADYLLHHNANTHWAYPTSAETDALLLSARETLADFLGGAPDEIAFGANMTLYRNFRLSSLFEWRTGFYIQNLTDQFRQDGPVFGSNVREASEVAAAMQNPASTPQQRIEAARRYLGLRALLEPGLNGLSPGDFLRWRELALTYTLPTRLVRQARFANASVTITGRNLMLWTKYPGTDPEINWVGRSSGANIESNFTESYDAFGFPIPRRFAIALNFGF